MSKKKIPISYTARDFNSIKEGLVDHARRYYPDTYRDSKYIYELERGEND